MMNAVLWALLKVGSGAVATIVENRKTAKYKSIFGCKPS
jgi:hypothetical protein